MAARTVQGTRKTRSRAENGEDHHTRMRKVRAAGDWGAGCRFHAGACAGAQAKARPVLDRHACSRGAAHLPSMWSELAQDCLGSHTRIASAAHEQPRAPQDSPHLFERRHCDKTSGVRYPGVSAEGAVGNALDRRAARLTVGGAAGAFRHGHA